MTRVTHIITGLDTGGAERMLAKLVSQHDPARLEVEVISLTDVGPIGQEIAASGVSVRGLGMKRGTLNPSGIGRLARWLKQSRPDVVQTWMYHADLIGGLAGRLSRRRHILWGIRNSTLDPQHSRRTTILTARLCARLSRRVPQRIVCCSQVAQEVHVRLGYAAERMTLIPNGFDLTAYHPDEDARRSVREELGLPADARLIGNVARFDPQKDHKTFVEAAAHLSTRCGNVHFLLCGSDITSDNVQLMGWIQATGLGSRFHLLGRRSDIPRLTAALDIATLSSAYGEAFPNVLGEAMACGVPCVTTDVGDSAFIVGDTGRVTPPGQPEAMSTAWQELLSLSPETYATLGQAARRRVEKHFSLPIIAGRFQSLYEEVLACAD